MIHRKLSKGEAALLEVLEHPLWCSEFLRQEAEPDWEHTFYQKEVLLDCNNYVSFRAARAVGKTESLVDLLVYYAINDFFPTHTVALITPNRVHLTPIWRKFTRWLGFHPFLRHFRQSINSQTFTMGLANGLTVDCRVAGVSGTGASVIGLHTPVLLVDEGGFFPWNTWIELMPCVSGDTEILTSDGYIKIRDILDKNLTPRVLSVSHGRSKSKNIREQKLLFSRRKKNTTDCLELELESGRKIQCTVDHKFMIQRKNSESSLFVEAQKLTLDTRLITQLYLPELGKHNYTQDDFTEVFNGSFLGDSCIDSRGYYRFSQVNHEYARVKASVFFDIRGPYKNYNSLMFESKTKYLGLRKKYYKDSVKILHPEVLEQLTPLALAILFMDDGSSSANSLTIATHNFTKEENIILAAFIRDRYDIDFSVSPHRTEKKTYWMLRANKENRNKFLLLTSPYAVSSMFYKWLKVDDESLVSIKSIPPLESVYDLSVDIDHNFIANGFVVHNCLNAWEKGYTVYVCGTPSGQRENNVLYYADIESDQYTKHRVTAFDNPRYSEDEDKRNQQQYGDKDSDDYQRLVLGEHSSPVTVLFAKDTLPLEPFTAFTATLTNIDLENDPSKPIRLIESMPKEKGMVAAGIDLGYNDPTIISLFVNNTGPWKHFARITLSHIDYPKQIRFIDKLDDLYNFSFLAIDEGSSGLAVSQEMVGNAYKHKSYGTRLLAVSFQSPTEIGLDLDGNPIKISTRNLSVEKLRSLFDNKAILLSSKDHKMISELERVEGTRTPSGNTVYRVRTPGGSLRGEDHRFASFLCFAFALYMREDYKDNQPEPVKLWRKVRWSK